MNWIKFLIEWKEFAFFAVILLFFLGWAILRGINESASESEQDFTPIETITVPKPSDANCVRLTGQPCPR